ncbi:hypothetical protein [Methylobacter svalbardensis]
MTLTPMNLACNAIKKRQYRHIMAAILTHIIVWGHYVAETAV